MKTLPLFQLDAFTERLFAGNPAAVVPLTQTLPEPLMLSIAAENNLSETAYILKRSPGRYDIRWFTPVTEARLCGHATLASAEVVFRFLEPGLDEIRFASRHSGELVVRRASRGMLELDFPTYAVKIVKKGPVSDEAVGARVLEWHGSANGAWIAVLENEETVRGLRPDLAALERAGAALCVCSVGSRDSGGPSRDYVYRYFDPVDGIPEDPVTGSANCYLAPLFAARLGKREFRAAQLSRRGGELFVRLEGEGESARARIAGHVSLYLKGEIALPAERGD